jgi:hypothetical protein
MTLRKLIALIVNWAFWQTLSLLPGLFLVVWCEEAFPKFQLPGLILLGSMGVCFIAGCGSMGVALYLLISLSRRAADGESPKPILWLLFLFVPILGSWCYWFFKYRHEPHGVGEGNAQLL